ncbi:MAG: ABC transporter permease [Pseudomonadota bacterium]|nr:ABC transporter permease [Pseudomonadota bacterium]
MTPSVDSSAGRGWLARLARGRAARGVLAVLGLLLLASALAPLYAPQDPYDLESLDLLDAELPPAWMEQGQSRFPLGTDAQGRDMFSAMLYGAGISLVIGICAVALQLLIGVSAGLVAGYRGGRVDAAIMRVADIQLSLSTLMVAIIVLGLMRSAFGSDRFGALAIPMLVLVIGIAEWPHFARAVRGSVLAEKQKDHVLAARALGLAPMRIVLRHILPNVASPILVLATVQVANAVIAEASLSFLGLGMPATMPSLGALIRAGFELLLSGSWWITLLPSLLLVAIILCVNVLGDAMRDALDPHSVLLSHYPR